MTSDSAIYDAESDKRDLTSSTTLRLAATYGMSVTERPYEVPTNLALPDISEGCALPTA
jgi:hypothetical protein